MRRLARGLMVTALTSASATAMVSGALPTSAHAQDRLALERHLVIGQGVQEPGFTMISAMEVSPDGDELYVADASGVRVFDLEGTPVRNLALVGTGPGQVRTAFSLRVSREDLSFLDGADGSMSWFTLEGAFQGRRRPPSLQVDPSRSAHPPTPVRFDQWVVRTGPMIGTGVRAPLDLLVRDFLLDPLGSRIRELGAFPSGSGYYVWADRPDNTYGAVSRLGYAGSGGTARVLGDSMYVHVDGYHGIISWNVIEEGSVNLIRKRELGWDPEANPMTVDSVRTELARERGVPVSEVAEVVLPEFLGPVGGLVLARDGAAWFQRRPPTSPAASLAEPPSDYIVVPFNPDEPVREIRLPPGFSPRVIWDDFVAGVLREASGRQLVVIYRWRS